MTDLTADELIAILRERNVLSAPKQLMIDSGLNVFGFDLAMESFNRAPTQAMPQVFAYEHENGLLVFVNRNGVETPDA